MAAGQRLRLGGRPASLAGPAGQAGLAGPARAWPQPDRPGWPTFQAKKKFYDLCTKLTLADLNQMVSLVQRGCGSAVQQCGDKEVEVDVDELDNETFNKVMSWAQQKTKANE